MLFKIKRYEEAEEQIKNAFEPYSTTLKTEHDFTQDFLRLLIDLYDACGKAKEAEAYRAWLAEKTEESIKEDR